MKSYLPETVTIRAYQAIKEMILNNQLGPGQKITYEYLANKLSMSKTPIINALSRLEQEGLVYYIHNRGFFIKEMKKEDLEGLFNIREALELIAIEESILNHNPDPKMLKEIEEFMNAHKKKAYEEFQYHTPSRNRLLLDAKFHLKIAEMSKNDYLVKMLKSIFENIFLIHQGQGIPPKKFIEAAKEHQLLYDALKAREIKTARKLMREHIRGGKISNIKGLQVIEKLVEL